MFTPVRIASRTVSYSNIIAATPYKAPSLILSPLQLSSCMIVCQKPQYRDYSYHRISRNLEFFSADNSTPVVRTPGSLCVTPNVKGQRPLTLLMSWLMSKDSHVKKFATLYTELGFDVLKVRVSPFDLLRPTKGSQVVARQMLEFLHHNPSHGPVLVHGFSVGAYVFCEGMVQVAADLGRHGKLMDRFVGQIWDSAVDIYGIPVGVSRAVSNNRIIQASIKKYLDWHLKAKYNSATIHYERSSSKMHENFVNVPSLFFFSSADPVSSPDMNAVVIDKWENKGTKVFVKRFENSRHVSHYHQSKKEYVDELMTFLTKLGLVEIAAKRLAI